MKYTVDFFQMSALDKLLIDVEFGFDPIKKLGSEDERRLITECNRATDSWQKFVIKKAELPLGNHYHERKTETFYFTGGKGIVYLAPVDKNGVIIGKVKRVNARPGVVLTIPEYIAHRFNMEAGATFINHSSAPFNPDDMDMLKCIVPDAE
jgi:dTDP-4-dehydrorhamnose 3,5-epimerase-like enzyme